MEISPASRGQYVKRQDGTQPAIHENHSYKSFQKGEGESPQERAVTSDMPLPREGREQGQFCYRDDEFPPYATANIGKELCTVGKID